MLLFCFAAPSPGPLATRSALEWQRSGADVAAGLPSGDPLPVVVVVVVAVVVVVVAIVVAAKVGCWLLFLLFLLLLLLLLLSSSGM